MTWKEVPSFWTSVWQTIPSIEDIYASWSGCNHKILVNSMLAQSELERSPNKTPHFNNVMNSCNMMIYLSSNWNTTQICFFSNPLLVHQVKVKSWLFCTTSHVSSWNLTNIFNCSLSGEWSLCEFLFIFGLI